MAICSFCTCSTFPMADLKEAQEPGQAYVTNVLIGWRLHKHGRMHLRLLEMLHSDTAATVRSRPGTCKNLLDLWWYL